MASPPELVLGIDLGTTNSACAIVREGRAIFPHKDTVLRPGDRAIVFTESDHAAEVERLL